MQRAFVRVQMLLDGFIVAAATASIVAVVVAAFTGAAATLVVVVAVVVVVCRNDLLPVLDPLGFSEFELGFR